MHLLPGRGRGLGAVLQQATRGVGHLYFTINRSDCRILVFVPLLTLPGHPAVSENKSYHTSVDDPELSGAKNLVREDLVHRVDILREREEANL